MDDTSADAGAGVIVGIVPMRSAERRSLLPAQPDAIVAPDEFSALDYARYPSDRAHRERVLLNPGPSVVSDRVHRAIGGPDLCHRALEDTAILAEGRRKLVVGRITIAGSAGRWRSYERSSSGHSDP